MGEKKKMKMPVRNPAMKDWEIQRMKQFKAEKHPDLIIFKLQMIDKYGKQIERVFE
jgi:hypothetical protein